MSAVVHDLFVASVAVAGLWALCSLTRDELQRIRRARRIYRGWCRG